MSCSLDREALCCRGRRERPPGRPRREEKRAPLPGGAGPSHRRLPGRGGGGWPSDGRPEGKNARAPGWQPGALAGDAGWRPARPPWLETSLAASRPRVKGEVYPGCGGGLLGRAGSSGRGAGGVRRGSDRRTKRPREWRAPEVSSPRRGRFLLRWVAPRSLKKPGLRRKGEEHPGVEGPTCIRVRRWDEPPCSDRLRARGHRGARGRSQAGLDVEVEDARRRASAGTGMRDADVDGGGRSTSGS